MLREWNWENTLANKPDEEEEKTAPPQSQKKNPQSQDNDDSDGNQGEKNQDDADKNGDNDNEGNSDEDFGKDGDSPGDIPNEDSKNPKEANGDSDELSEVEEVTEGKKANTVAEAIGSYNINAEEETQENEEFVSGFISHLENEDHLDADALEHDKFNVLMNSFYRMVERVGLYSTKAESHKATDICSYDMKQIANRRLTKKPLSKCKTFKQKEEVVVWLDSSSSCKAMSALLNRVASICSKREDVLVVKTADSRLDDSYTSLLWDNFNYSKFKIKGKSTNKIEMILFSEFPIPNGFKHLRIAHSDITFRNKNTKLEESLETYFTPSYYQNVKQLSLCNLSGIEGTLIILTDSDHIDSLNFAFKAVANSKFKRIIYCDMHNYLLTRFGGMIERVSDYDKPTNELRNNPAYLKRLDRIKKYYDNINNDFNSVYGDNINPLKLTGIFPKHHKFNNRVSWYLIHDVKDLYNAFNHIK